MDWRPASLDPYGAVVARRHRIAVDVGARKFLLALEVHAARDAQVGHDLIGCPAVEALTSRPGIGLERSEVEDAAAGRRIAVGAGDRDDVAEPCPADNRARLRRVLEVATAVPRSEPQSGLPLVRDLRLRRDADELRLEVLERVV